MSYATKIDFTEWLNDVPPGKYLTWEERGLKPDAPEGVIREYERFMDVERENKKEGSK